MHRLAESKLLAENWDNVGLLIGNPAQEITKIFSEVTWGKSIHSFNYNLTFNHNNSSKAFT